jgi:hypothetical protein
MALYTSNYLKGISERVSLNESERMFSETKSKTSFDIFLSHSFLDRDEVRGLYIELSKMGFSVYVDWIVDPHLDRNNVTKESATLVRSRLHASRSLLLAISLNASISRWMPWELGYVDGHTSNCAIVPVSRNAAPPSSYKGVEYLSLYPFVSRVNNTRGEMKLWTVETADRYTLFENWIQGEKPNKRNVKIF